MIELAFVNHLLYSSSQGYDVIIITSIWNNRQDFAIDVTCTHSMHQIECQYLSRCHHEGWHFLFGQFLYVEQAAIGIILVLMVNNMGLLSHSK